MGALLLIGAVATGVGVWQFKSGFAIGPPAAPNRYTKPYLIISGLLLAVFVAYYFTDQTRFLRTGHHISAGALFLGIVAVVVVNAWGFAREAGGTRKATAFNAAKNRYGIVAWLMFGSVLALVYVGPIRKHVLRSDWFFSHWFFAAEAAVILLFAVFWVLQTLELKGDVARSQPSGAPT